ncbi:hypothetical protein [Nonomuraea sp. NPDC023979]|uniref:hypothetical protein n=1 Tax=Nonomuraea sp. NPDC023979 TaxID=3154796 RepID=UPI0033C16A7F
MLKKFIPAAVAAISLAGLTFTPPAGAESLSSSREYGCDSGDFCMYTTEVISAQTKIGDHGADWPTRGESSEGKSPYYNVRSFFNNGTAQTEDHVLVTYIRGDTGSRHTTCVHRAEDGDLGSGHEWPDGRVYVTVIKIDWVNRWTSPCNG